MRDNFRLVFLLFIFIIVLVGTVWLFAFDRNEGDSWELYAYNKCQKCRQETHVDDEFVGYTLYGDRDHLGTFEGRHAIKIKRWCGGEVKAIYMRSANPRAGSIVTAVLESSCEAAKIEITRKSD